ncbi:MAG: hypothetical protein AB7P03_02635 [Kofleriaceae bacterium]
MIERRLYLVAIAMLSSAAAHADGVSVDVTRCPTWGEDIRTTVSAELDPTSAPHHRSIIIDCPDQLTAKIVIEPAPVGGPLTRELALGDIPAELRARLVSLAAVELAAVAARMQVWSEQTVQAPGMVARNTSHAEPRAPALISSRSPSPVTISPRFGMRTYTRVRRALAGAVVDVGFGPYQLGGFVATATAGDQLGDLRGWVTGVSGGANVACTGERFALCVGARIEAGVTIASGTSSVMGVSAQSPRALYTSAGGELTASVPLGRWSIVSTVSAAWARGLVARAADRVPFATDGLMIAGTLGMRFP